MKKRLWQHVRPGLRLWVWDGQWAGYNCWFYARGKCGAVTVPDRPDFWLQVVVFGNKNDKLYMSLRDWYLRVIFKISCNVDVE